MLVGYGVCLIVKSFLIVRYGEKEIGERGVWWNTKEGKDKW